MTSGTLRRAAMAALCLGVVACAPSFVPGPRDQLQRPAVILTGDEARRLLVPCTRPGPAGVEGIWEPDSAEVAAFLAALPAAAKQESRRRPGWGPDRPLERFRAQVTGFVRAGRRVLYGSFTDQVLLVDRFETDFPTRAVHLCDGAGRMFGAVYDPTTQVVSELQGNEAGVVETDDAAVEQAGQSRIK